jgi:predicted phosphohydrolase
MQPRMRVLITADLHYDIARSKDSARRLAEEVLRLQGDVLVLAGDTAGRDMAPLRECLGLFADFPGEKLLVPGNHCLWCRGEETSLDRYERVIPQLAAEMGFGVLDHSPVVRGGVGLAGSVGWYDYSFADESLGLPLEFYRAKIAPGAAAYRGGYEGLLERHRDQLTPRHYDMGAQWMDGVYVRLGMSDEEFLATLCARLRGQLADLSARAEQVVVFTHHVPFGGLVPTGRPDRFAFAAAYMGAGCLGEVILEFPKVRHVYCGHSHWPGRMNVGQVSVVNVGSTYTDKRLEVLEV